MKNALLIIQVIISVLILSSAHGQDKRHTQKISSSPTESSNSVTINSNLEYLYPKNNVKVKDAVLRWKNPEGTNSIKIYCSNVKRLVDDSDQEALIYSGKLLTIFYIPKLDDGSRYYWKIVADSDNNSFEGEVFSFTIDYAHIQYFETFQDTSLVNWEIIDNTNSNPQAVWKRYDQPFPNSYILPSSSNGAVLAADSDEWGSSANGGNTSAIFMVNYTLPYYHYSYLEFDYDFRVFSGSQDTARVEVQNENGEWITFFERIGQDDTAGEILIDLLDLGIDQLGELKFRFTFIAVSWSWYFVLDNVVFTAGILPVELTNFSARNVNENIVLNWSTGTETNNSGFDIERSTDKIIYETIGFVNGNGSTTSPKQYSFIDENVLSGKYYYRLKQIDYNGTYEYSQMVEVNNNVPIKFALEQNYPNPFNPSTTIKFSVPEESNVSITLFNTLGQQVMKVINNQYTIGTRSVELNAASLSSGVYFYRIEAVSNSGKEFYSTKKLMLMK